MLVRKAPRPGNGSGSRTGQALPGTGSSGRAQQGLRCMKGPNVMLATGASIVFCVVRQRAELLIRNE